MRPSPHRLLIALTAAALWVPALAQRIVLEPTPIEPVPVGSPVVVEALLTDDAGTPLDGVAVEVYEGAAYLRRARTGVDGRVRISLGTELPIGRHRLGLVVDAEAGRSGTIVPMTIDVRPLSLTIETVPPLEGIPFIVDGLTVVTGKDGFAVFGDLERREYTLEVPLEEGHSVDDETRISFDRWGDAVFTPDRAVDMRRGDRRYQIGFALSHPIPTTFVDLDGEPVVWDEVSEVVLKSSSAAYRTITDRDPLWLQANRIARRRDGIFVTQLLWSVESVVMDGTNVVNRYQQRFFVEPGDVWELELLLFSARFRSRDALLGFSVGDGVDLTYPDGVTIHYPFDDAGEVRLTNLARGLYRVQVTGVGGVAPLTPVALSRDQDVQLKVLTTLDIWLGIGVAAALAFGLLFAGRPHLIGLRRRGREQTLREHVDG